MLSQQLFPCAYPACGQTFSTDMGRRRHIRTVHQQIKDFACPLCSHAARDNFNLNAHLKSHGTSLSELKPEVALTCRYCSLRFESVSERLEHMEEHRRDNKGQRGRNAGGEKRKGWEWEGREQVLCAVCRGKVQVEGFAEHLGVHTATVTKTSEVFMQSVAKFLQTLHSAGDVLSHLPSN